MANHGFVKTRKFMSAEKIDVLLASLNQSHFKGNLKIEYHKATKEEPGWGSHTWLISYVSDKDQQEYARRVCWLNTKRSFEMRHGGGADFAWWVDTVILNEVAVQFDGTISDEGVGEKWKGESGKYDDLVDFLKRMMRWDDSKLAFLQLAMEIVPPEMRVDLGPKIELAMEIVPPEMGQKF